MLSWGIFGAMGMRALMVLAGVEAIENFRAVLLGFAAILIFTSVKLLVEDEEGEGEEDLADNAIVNAARSMITTVDYYDGNKFFTYVSGGQFAVVGAAEAKDGPGLGLTCVHTHNRRTACAWRRPCSWCSSAWSSATWCLRWTPCPPSLGSPRHVSLSVWN